MESNYRLKAKIGDHEFDAEGPADVIKEQFQQWKELVALLPATTTPHPQPTPTATSNATQNDGGATLRPDVPLALEKIMRTDGRTVSLTVRPNSAEEAILLLLYGQKALRNNDSVTGGEVNDGITATGGIAVPRPDRVLEKIASDGDVIVSGERRAKRYRLTNAGLAKAKQTATTLISIVA